jgi:hypothetical protein
MLAPAIKDSVHPRSCYETRTQRNSDILAPHVADQGETRNDLETPDARAMDADRFHCVGPRRRDLHLAHRRSQAEINLWYAAGGRRRRVRLLTNQPMPH